ncbi:MAG: ABC transporter ATP-binding protein [Candidatus Eremiobacteraeota bacterium]|nr:ABC transporter ATP-binding protein [Candidatus Eremiobacteraeota bacterium]MBC5802619.1 ABC transporter ATP-binding protein [Candidatus Eremiobacteraeota bacterium]MBC5820639.1 ABC transporter ATP-binding protein [Candidatus Eremiobacteraeota bacterium]
MLFCASIASPDDERSGTGRLSEHRDGPRRGASIDARDVAVRYAESDRNAVDDMSLGVEAGEFIVLLGPSGCGKSTFLRTINRLVIPAAGTIAVDGRNVGDVTPEELRRGIGYVIQAVGLFPHLTVAQNIAVVPRLLHWDRARIAARVDELLGLTQLEPERYRGRYPRELSGGEAQRVGVARALAAEPRVLLMDEPFGAVDAIVRLALQDETLRIHRALGTTIIFVTHDVDEALRLADRIVVMREGKIEQTGAPLRILAHPATPYVEKLLDAKDAVRRLQLLRARDAIQTRVERSTTLEATENTMSAPIDADASLRDALSLLLQGASAVAVSEDGRTLGTLTFEDVRTAIAAQAQ